MKEYWNWFLRLSNRRPSGMGISAISYTEMRNFFELINVSPESYEIEIIEAFDRVAMRHYSKQEEKELKKK